MNVNAPQAPPRAEGARIFFCSIVQLIAIGKCQSLAASTRPCRVGAAQSNGGVSLTQRLRASYLSHVAHVIQTRPLRTAGVAYRAALWSPRKLSEEGRLRQRWRR